MAGKNTLKYIPLFVILCVVPFIVRITVTDCGLSVYDWFSKSSTEYDFFLIYKMYGIIIAAVIMFVMLIAYLHKGKRISGAILISLLLYTVFAVLSAVFAHNPKDAFFGGYAQHEPVTALAAYVIIFIYAYCVFDSKKALVIFIKTAVAGAFVMAILGVLQWLGADFFTTYAGRWLISLSSGIDPSRISASFGKGVVYMTLYNPNYAGVYSALMIPICAAGVYAVKNIWFKAVSAVTAVMLALCIIGSGSETGLYAFIAECVIFILVRIYIYNKMAGRILLYTVFLAVIPALFYICEKSIVHKSIYPLERMEVSKDGVDIRIRGKNLHIISGAKSQNAGITVYEGDMEPVKLSESEGAYTIVSSDAAYEGLYFRTGVSEEGLEGFNVICNDVSLFFTNDNEEGRYYYRNVYGKYTEDIGNPANGGLRFADGLASHRGYIWSETIPLIMKHIFIGCGPDNFIYEFPNNDYLSLINNGYSGSVVTRPHNMYLQTAVQTGVLSLVSVIFLYVIYFISSMRIIRNMSKISETGVICISIFAGVAGYMICGLSNDSSVCTAPLFWVIFAAGFCCNNIIKKGEKS